MDTLHPPRPQISPQILPMLKAQGPSRTCNESKEEEDACKYLAAYLAIPGTVLVLLNLKQAVPGSIDATKIKLSSELKPET